MFFKKLKHLDTNEVNNLPRTLSSPKCLFLSLLIFCSNPLLWLVYISPLFASYATIFSGELALQHHKV